VKGWLQRMTPPQWFRMTRLLSMATGYVSPRLLVASMAELARAILRDEDLDRVVEFAFGNGPKHAMRLGDLMHHAAIHGVHHRGQVAFLLRSLGQVPGNFDILFYCGRPK